MFVCCHYHYSCRQVPAGAAASAKRLVLMVGAWDQVQAALTFAHEYFTATAEAMKADEARKSEYETLIRLTATVSTALNIAATAQEVLASSIIGKIEAEITFDQALTNSAQKEMFALRGVKNIARMDTQSLRRLLSNFFASSAKGCLMRASLPNYMTSCMRLAAADFWG